MATYELETVIADALQTTQHLLPPQRGQVEEALATMQRLLTSRGGVLVDSLPDQAVALLFQILTVARYVVKKLVGATQRRACRSTSRFQAPPGVQVLDSTTPTMLQRVEDDSDKRGDGGSGMQLESADVVVGTAQHLASLVVGAQEILQRVLEAGAEITETHMTISAERVAMALIRAVLPDDFNSRFWSRCVGLRNFSARRDHLEEVLMAEVPHLQPQIAAAVAAELCAHIDLNDDGTIDIVELGIMHPASLCNALEVRSAQREEAARAVASELDGPSGGACMRCAKLEAELVLERREVSRLKQKLAQLADARNLRRQLDEAHKTIGALRLQLHHTESRLQRGHGRQTLDTSLSCNSSVTQWNSDSCGNGDASATSILPTATSAAAATPIGSYRVYSRVDAHPSVREEERLRSAVKLYNDKIYSRCPRHEAY